MNAAMCSYGIARIASDSGCSRTRGDRRMAPPLAIVTRGWPSTQVSASVSPG